RCTRDHRSPRSFPTRRSSDLDRPHRFAGLTIEDVDEALLARLRDRLDLLSVDRDVGEDRRARNVVVPDRMVHELVVPDAFAGLRSEEHTSELQSLTHLVCRLL